MAQKRPKDLHAICSGIVEINQQESTYVVSKHLRVCLSIFAWNISVLAEIQTK